MFATMIESYYGSETTAAELEARVGRLEKAVTALSDTHLMEDRVTEQVVKRLERSPGKARAEGQSSSPPAAMLAPPAEDARRRYWLPFEIWGEVRTFIRALGDHRYPFSFWGRFGWLAVGTAYFVVMYTIGLMPVIGWIIERLIDIVLAVILYKILSREVARYRAMFPNG